MLNRYYVRTFIVTVALFLSNFCVVLGSDFSDLKNKFTTTYFGSDWLLAKEGEEFILFSFNKNQEVVAMRSIGSTNRGQLKKIASLVSRNRIDRLESYLRQNFSNYINDTANCPRNLDLCEKFLNIKIDRTAVSEIQSVSTTSEKECASSIQKWLENISEKARQSDSIEGTNSNANTETKTIVLKTGEKIIGVITEFKDKIYSVKTSHGSLKISDSVVNTISSLDIASDSNSCSELVQFHSKASDILLRLCSQVKAGINYVTAVQVFSAASAELDSVVRKYEPFEPLGKHYRKCFDILNYPVKLFDEKYPETIKTEFRNLLNSNDWLDSSNDLMFRGILPSLDSTAPSALPRHFVYNSWIPQHTGPALEMVADGVQKEMAKISEIIK